MINQFKASRQTVMRVFKLLNKPQKKDFIIQIVYSLLLAGFEIISVAAVIPLLFKLSNDDNYQNNKIPETILSLDYTLLFTFVIIAFITKNIISLIIIREQSNYVSRIGLSLSKSLFSRFYQQSWINQLQENSAESIRKLNTSAYDFSNHVLFGLLRFISESIILLLVVIFILFIDYRIIALIILFSIPMLWVYYLFRSKVVTKVEKAFKYLTPKSSVILSQALASLAETLIYKKQNYFIENFLELKRATGQQLANLKTASQVPGLLLELIAMGSFLLAYSFSHTSSVNGFSVTLVGLLTLAFYKIMPLLNRVFISMMNIHAYGYTMLELENSFNKSGKVLGTAKPDFHFERHLSLEVNSFQYNHARHNLTLENLHLTIQRGEFVVIEGPSGSGKTTLLHILCGLIHDFNGELSVDDEVLTPLNLNGWHNLIAYVPQSPVLIQDTLERNIAFGQEPFNLKDANEAMRKVNLENFLLNLPQGYQTLIGEGGSNISGGQRQRLALVRALYRKPKVLFLDEVTSHLDIENKLTILHSLKDINQLGITIVLATHETTAQEYATQIIRIKEGKIEQTLRQKA